MGRRSGSFTRWLPLAPTTYWWPAALGGEVLIPATRRAVLEVDRIARRIVVDARSLVYDDDGEDL